MRLLSVAIPYPACRFSSSSWAVLHSMQSVVTGRASSLLLLISPPQDSQMP